MRETAIGCPKTKVGALTPAANGTSYPCEGCEKTCWGGKACNDWRSWYRAKWRDLRQAAGMEGMTQ